MPHTTLAARTILILALTTLGSLNAGATAACARTAAAHADCCTRSAESGAVSADGAGCGRPSGAVVTVALQTLAPEVLDHYQRLARLSGAPRPDRPGLDRQQFSLAAMNAAYLKVLDVKPVYLDVPPTTFHFPEFPANSSEQTRAELDHLLELQGRRTAEQISLSQKLAGVYYRLSVRPEDQDWARMRQNLFHMGRQLGAWFGPESLPVTADFMARVWSDASYYLWAAKFRFNRVRPYTIEPRLENLETPNFPAYPSGHSSNSWVAAYVYELLLPEQRELFAANARDMAYSREILGVHFASDSESGRTFARQFVDRLMQEAAFQKDLEAARREIRKAMASQPGRTAQAAR